MTFHTLTEPLTVVRETEKAYGVDNPLWEEVERLLDWGGALEVLKRGLPEVREAYVHKIKVLWFPKSQVSTEDNTIMAMAPWLAKKHKLNTIEETQRREKAFEAGKERYDALLGKAKLAGVKVRLGMKARTIEKKMAEAGIALD